MISCFHYGLSYPNTKGQLNFKRLKISYDLHGAECRLGNVEKCNVFEFVVLMIVNLYSIYGTGADTG